MTNPQSSYSTNQITPEVHQPRFYGPLATVLIAIGVYLGGQLFGSLLVSLYPVLMNWSVTQANDWFAHSVTAQFLLVLAVETVTLLLLYCFLRRRKLSFKTIGLTRPRLQDAGYALMGFGIYLPLYIGILLGLTRLIPSLNVDQKQQIGFEGAAAIPELVLVFASLVILAPIIEELLCRGFLYSGLKAKLPQLTAIIITSGLFAVAHLQIGSGEPLLWVAAVDTFVLSCVLVYLKEKTGGLAASIGLHMIKNGIAFLVLFVFHAG